ncbi:MAG: LssY C-terminal domain-containing protein, partial [Burkholderiaceae bacterium]
GLWFFLGVLQDIVAKDPLVTLDTRLHNCVPLFRTSGMTWLMFVLTHLGGAVFLSLLCLAAGLFALAHNRPRLAATFVIALAGSALVSGVLKVLVGHARPMDAIITQGNASFPSGHLLSGAVVYGLLAAVLLTSRARRGARALGVVLLALVTVGIGLSRLYVGVHWPSDLLGSLALALMLLPALLFFLHYSKPIPGIDTFQLPVRARTTKIAGTCVLAIGLGSAFVFASHRTLLPIGPPPARHAINIAALRSALPMDIPRQSEDLVGGKMEPISLVLVGSEQDLVEGFARAGWARADLATPVRVARATLAAVRGLPDATAPVTPAFFDEYPEGLAFEKPGADTTSIRQRHHTRLWQTRYCLAPDCRPVWVATASYDVGVGLSKRLHLPTHRIDPAIDTERELIASDLAQAGGTRQGILAVLPSLRGSNAAGDEFSTDGRAIVLVLP